ncbi:hypothetical protein [Nocardia nova]|uniref:hypothetical protein n=1 Tax=Nocardia nova TaxID=37330 RepID=UPI00046D6FAC|nr:hypothetical protein [Nocardia nova]
MFGSLIGCTDGRTSVGPAVAFALDSIAADCPETPAELDDAGKAMSRDVQDKSAIALMSAFEEQRIGGTSSAPVPIASARNYEGAPYDPIRDVAAGWYGRSVPGNCAALP